MIQSTSDSPVRLLVLPIWLLAIYFVGQLMYDAATIWLWIVCSFFLFTLLDPVAEFLKARKWPTASTGVLLIVLATALTVGAIYSLGYLVSSIVVEFESSKKVFMEAFHSLSSSWNSWNSKITELYPAGSSGAPKVEMAHSSPLSGAMGDTLLRGAGSAASILTFSLLSPILAFFFLAERDGLGGILAKAFASPRVAREAWAKIVASTRSFFLGNLLLGVVTYPVFLGVFALFSVQSLLAVSALATFLNLIPFAGAVMSGLVPAVALYTQSHSVGEALGLYGFCVALHFIIADFVTPKVLGSQVNINATTSTIALVAWGEIWGGLGLILAIPLTSLIKILFEHSEQHWLKWLAQLMSEDMDQNLQGPTFYRRRRGRREESAGANELSI